VQQSVEIQFASDHATAAGHFPGNPIIPGALLLDEVLQAIGAHADSGNAIAIRATKFFRPVRPGDSVRLQWHVTADGVISFECRLTGDEALAATGRIEIIEMQR
jgi:3-hydroxyacyl-[acyl-carrier-protein] dehydratase